MFNKKAVNNYEAWHYLENLFELFELWYKEDVKSSFLYYYEYGKEIKKEILNFVNCTHKNRQIGKNTYLFFD